MLKTGHSVWNSTGADLGYTDKYGRLAKGKTGRSHGANSTRDLGLESSQDTTQTGYYCVIVPNGEPVISSGSHVDIGPLSWRADYE